MPRWEYDTVFYRVFCITLLGITFAFTVILTNVFIDIDGLLFKKTHVTSSQATLHTVSVTPAPAPVLPEHGADTADDYKDYNYADSYDTERTKRSVDMEKALQLMREATIKKVLSNRLASLLEDLDKEDANKSVENKPKTNQKHDWLKEITQTPEIDKLITKSYDYEKTNPPNKDKENLVDTQHKDIIVESEIMDYIKRKKGETERSKNVAEEDLRHLAVHNIVLQGLVGHMELNEVYDKMQTMIKNIENLDKNNIRNDIAEALTPIKGQELIKELLNCQQLNNQIKDIKTDKKTKAIRTNKNNTLKTKPEKARKLMIKTIIDISSLNDQNLNHNDTSEKENIHGIIKLIYNGKSVKFKRFDEVTTTDNPKKSDIENTDPKEEKDTNGNVELNTNETYVPKFYSSNLINEYLQKMTHTQSILTEAKRLKRHINIEYENEDTTNKSTHTKSVKKDDELFLEIETHFDSKGLKGEDKKKMIRDLIEKIQQAIRTEKDSLEADKVKKHKPLHVKKRIQNPLDEPYPEKKPVFFLVRRKSDPITKSISLSHQDRVPLISDRKGDYWHKKVIMPRFLGEQKGINSIEMGELNAHVNQQGLAQELQGLQYQTQASDGNAVSEREQKPINENSEYNGLDSRGAKFVMKDIAGSGFSIGFNQYVDDPPDTDSMNLFSGIENIIKTYHQKYDESSDVKQDEPSELPTISVNQMLSPPSQDTVDSRDGSNIVGSHEYGGPTKHHSIVRRSIQNIKRDFFSDELKFDIGNSIDNKKRVRKTRPHSLAKVLKLKNNYAYNFLDENILQRDLKPSEILNLANLLGRKKRSLNVRKISNLHNHRSLNRYLNTHTIATKSVYHRNKRSKRQIDKIRIIAKDRLMSNKQRQPNSAEEIFVLSNEDIFADRAQLRQLDTAYIDNNRGNNDDHEHYDIVAANPLKHNSVDHYDIISSQKPEEFIERQNIPHTFSVPVNPPESYVLPAQTGPRFQVRWPPQEQDPDDTLTYDYRSHSSEQNVDPDYFIGRSRHNPLMSKYPHILMDEISRPNEEYRPQEQNYEINENGPVVFDATTMHSVAALSEDGFPQIIGQNTELYSPPENSNYKVTVKIMPKNRTNINSGFKETHTSINKSYNKDGLLFTSLVNVSEISKIEKLKINGTGYDQPPHYMHKLNKQQSKMKTMIHQHKQRIQEQLMHLLKEKEKLLHLEQKNADILKEGNPDYNVEQPVLLTYQAAQVRGNELVINTSEIPEIVIRNTSPPQTTTQRTTTTEDPIKKTLLNKINKNELMTDEILNKLNKNTEILEKFLTKMITNLDKSTQKPPTELNPTNSEKLDMRTQSNALQNIPNIFFNQRPYANFNSTVPFVYAFQHPFISQNSRDKNPPVANVVYQGHIHTQTSHNKQIPFQQTQIQDHAYQPHDSNPNGFNKKAIEESYANIKSYSNGNVYNIPDQKEDEYAKSLKAGQNRLNIQDGKPDQNYPQMNMQKLKPDQTYPLKIDQNYVNMQAGQGRDQSYNTQSNNQAKMGQNYDSIPIKSWDEKAAINKEWEKNARNDEIKQENPNDPIKNGNGTKFFIDEIENEFKVILPSDGKKNIS